MLENNQQEYEDNNQQQPYDYIPRMYQRPQSDSILNKHLDSSEIINRLKKMLLGFEYDEVEEEWKPLMVVIGYDDKGNEISEPKGALIDPDKISIIISHLEMHLNPNTFLSNLEKEEINDIMFYINLNYLAPIFYHLTIHNAIDSVKLNSLWAILEDSIYFALKRAGNKITLDALSKMQHSVEHIEKSRPMEDKKEFKMFGW